MTWRYEDNLLHICHLLGLKFSIGGDKLDVKTHSVDPHLAPIHFFFFCLLYVEYVRLKSQKHAVILMDTLQLLWHSRRYGGSKF